MAIPTSLVVAIILICIALAAVFVVRPSVTVTRAGKVLAFISLFVFPIVTGSMGVSEHISRSKQTEFCLSCHVMEPYGKSLLVDDRAWIPAVHYQNALVDREHACFTCHTDYTMYGDYAAKMRGLRHVYVNYIKGPPAHLKLYKPYSNRECLHCHAGARSFEEGATHTSEQGLLQKIKSNQTSCLSSGCHDSVHNIEDLKQATFWKRPLR